MFEEFRFYSCSLCRQVVYVIDHFYLILLATQVVSDVPALQLIGVSVIGLEPEFQPVVNHLLPHIISHKQDVHDMHLQVDCIINDICKVLLCILFLCYHLSLMLISL